jgi:internalin A
MSHHVNVSERPRRRRSQFSLRTLLLAVLLLTLPLSWIGLERSRERRAVAEIEALGGCVVYHYPPSDWRGSEVIPDSFRDFFFSGVYQAELKAGTVDDDGLRRLRALKDLKILFVTDNRITDAGARHLGGLTRLRLLGLTGTRIGDAGLEHLQGLPNLADLRLARTRVTDSGLEHLSRLPRLTYLDLEDNRITNAGLEHIKGMSGLNLVRLNGTQVTAEGVRRLREVLPNCQVDY